MYGARTTELITGGFAGHEANQLQNLSHRDRGTNDLEVNAKQWLPPVEPPVGFRGDWSF